MIQLPTSPNTSTSTSPPLLPNPIPTIPPTQVPRNTVLKRKLTSPPFSPRTASHTSSPQP